MDKYEKEIYEGLGFAQQVGWKIRIMMLAMIRLLFLTWVIGQLFILFDVLETPSFVDWCKGTMYLLVGGGLIAVGKGVKDKMVDKI